jgi:hypothetical protein
MEGTAVEMEPAELVAKTTEGSALEMGTTVAPELRVERQVDPLPGADTDIVIREPIIEEVVSIRSAPMPEATLSSHGGLKLLDGNRIDLAVVAQSMEPWRRTEQWIKVHCEYLK